jgi:hypothetical protein
MTLAESFDRRKTLSDALAGEFCALPKNSGRWRSHSTCGKVGAMHWRHNSVRCQKIQDAVSAIRCMEKVKRCVGGVNSRAATGFPHVGGRIRCAGKAFSLASPARRTPRKVLPVICRFVQIRARTRRYPAPGRLPSVRVVAESPPASEFPLHNLGSVAQLDRALASGARGRAFESRRAHSGKSSPACRSMLAGVSVSALTPPRVTFEPAILELCVLNPPRHPTHRKARHDAPRWPRV